MPKPLFFICQAQDPVDAFSQAHKTEHAHHVVPVLFNQAFPVQECVLIIMAVIHNELTAAVNGIAYSSDCFRYHPV